MSTQKLVKKAFTTALFLIFNWKESKHPSSSEHEYPQTMVGVSTQCNTAQKKRKLHGYLIPLDSSRLQSHGEVCAD